MSRHYSDYDKNVQIPYMEKIKMDPLNLPGILSDTTIRRLALNEGMISPFVEKQKRDGVISYGLSSYGYDARLASTFKIFTNVNSSIIDPLNMSDACYVDYVGDVCTIPPNSYILGHTVETFDIPRDVLSLCIGKSSYARVGCSINCTPIEPGFRGQVVIEIANLTPLPMRVYANMGIAQFLFFRGDQPCEISYADRSGKYQNQTGITTVRI